MFINIERFAELFERLGIKFVIEDGILWREINKIIVPEGPVKFDYTISREKALYLLSKFPNAFMVRFTDGFRDTNYCEDWYAVIGDEFLEIDELSYKYRKHVRRGLRNCTVRRIDAKFLVKNGYDVFISAFRRYKNVKIPSVTESDFRERYLITKNYDDIVQYLGVFYQDKLIGYSIENLYDKIEVSASATKLHPDFLKMNSSEAIYYKESEYYLRENRFEYINIGFKNIMHQTNVQQFYIDKLKFKKVYTNLNVIYKPYLSAFISLSFPMRSFLGKIKPKLNALYIQEEIRRNCQNDRR